MFTYLNLFIIIYIYISGSLNQLFTSMIYQAYKYSSHNILFYKVIFINYYSNK